jgi:competence protein ComEC
VVLMALLAAAGAWWRVPAPIAPSMVVAALGLWRRWPWLVCLSAAALGGGLAARAMTEPVKPTPVHGWVTLVDDPSPSGPFVRATVRLDGRHFTVSTAGGMGRRLMARSAGEQLLVSGHTRELRNTEQWLRWQHVVGGIDNPTVEEWREGSPLARSANRVRGLVANGAAPMPARERALYLGFVLGDDRAEPPDLVDDFRESGLSHLTAVSGENVAFVLAVWAPLLRRLGLRSRFMVTLMLVAWFAVLTRFEPSVVRASAMAAVAATASYTARQSSGVRTLGLACTALLLIDPLLVRSVGFGLSVGASAGIVLLSGPLQRLIPGPRWLATPLTITLAAQIGVAPLSIAIFGGLPVGAPLANLTAAPAAGPIMTWGMSGGLLAGVVPSPLASVLHLPTVVLVWWIETVASVTARMPNPLVLALSAAAVAILWSHRGSGS